MIIPPLRPADAPEDPVTIATGFMALHVAITGGGRYAVEAVVTGQQELCAKVIRP